MDQKKYIERLRALNDLMEDYLDKMDMDAVEAEDKKNLKKKEDK